MNIQSKQEILEVLAMPGAAFERDVRLLARQRYVEGGNRLIATAMLGYSNVCKNQCLYCGMRASSKIERYRIAAQDIKQAIDCAGGMGLRRIFFVSGEDPKYDFEGILSFVTHAKNSGFHVSLGLGELEEDQLRALKDAGVDEYVMKFEMSQRDTFNRLNPSTDFDKRMKQIHFIKRLGFKLASGNIIDYPGQTLEMIAEDILLMKELEISWAPIIPYMPAANTPLALEGGVGDLGLLYREIALLRLMMPELNITAQQPGRDLRKGLTDKEGNIAAIEAGANMLFVDLLPDSLAKNFSVVDNRSVLLLSGIEEIARDTGMQLTMV